MRASYMENVGASMKHIRQALDSEGKKLRGADYISVFDVADCLCDAGNMLNDARRAYNSPFPCHYFLFGFTLLYRR